MLLVKATREMEGLEKRMKQRQTELEKLLQQERGKRQLILALPNGILFALFEQYKFKKRRKRCLH